jgi:F0F1-type ATP synthase membrane subunit b/b'
VERDRGRFRVRHRRDSAFSTIRFSAALGTAEARRDALKADVVKARAELEAADTDARSIEDRGHDDAARERQRILSEAHAERERTLANAQAELGRARLSAQAKLRTEFIERALQLARARAESRIDAATNTRLVNGTVETLLGDGFGSAA